MMNVDQITTRLSMMDDKALETFATMHKNDPYLFPLAYSESTRRQHTRMAKRAQQAMPQPKVTDAAIAQMRPAPEPDMSQMAAAGIPQLAARNIETLADGGIAGYAAGGVPQAERDKYRAYALNRAKALGLDPKFVDAIFQIESEYDPTAKSKTGPVGIGQLAKKTAQALGLSPEERKDPYKNMDTSMALMKRLFDKYGDPAKVAIAYNQGEGILNEHLKKNKGRLVPEKLHENVRTANKQEPMNYLKKLNTYIPLPAAAAADTVPRGESKVATGAPAARGVAALPTLPKEPAAAPAAQLAPAPAGPSQKPTYLSPLGVPEALLSLGTGAISPLTGTLYAGGRALMGKPVSSPEEAFGDVTFAPRSDVGKDVTSFAHKTLTEDLKLPPFIPGVGPIRPRPKAGKAITQAEAAAAEAAAAADAAKTAELPRLEGPKSTTAPSRALDVRQRFAEAQERAAQAAEAAGDTEKAAALRASVAQPRQFTPSPEAQQVGLEAVLARKRAGQAADVRKAQEAATAAERAATEAQLLAERERGIDTRASALADVGERAAARRNVFSPAVIGAEAGVRAQAPEAEAATTSPAFVDRRPPSAFEYRPYGEEAPPMPKPAEEKAPSPVAEKKAFGLDNEDLLMLGLGMLASPGGQAGSDLSQLFSNLGRSGMGAVAAKREREKLAEEKDYKNVMKKYYGKLTEMYGRPEAEERQIAQVMQEYNVDRIEAIRRIYEAKFASRGEYGLEAARLRNPFAALMDQGLMGTGGNLTSEGQSVFAKYFPKG